MTLEVNSVGNTFEIVPPDIARPLPESDLQNKYVLVAIDYFSIWVETYTLPNRETALIAEAEVTIRDFLFRFGGPMELHADQGRNFKSTLFQDV